MVAADTSRSRSSSTMPAATTATTPANNSFPNLDNNHHAHDNDNQELFLPALVLKVSLNDCLSRIESKTPPDPDSISQLSKVKTILNANYRKHTNLYKFKIPWNTENEQYLIAKHLRNKQSSSSMSESSLLSSSSSLTSSSSTSKRLRDSTTNGEYLSIWLLQRCLSTLLHLSNISKNKNTLRLSEPPPTNNNTNTNTNINATDNNNTAPTLTHSSKNIIEDDTGDDDLRICLENTCADIICNVADQSIDFNDTTSLVRQLHSELLNLQKAFFPVPFSRTYPLKLSVFDPNGLFNAPDDPFDTDPTSFSRPFPFVLRSPQQARSFFLSILSILIQISSTSSASLPLSFSIPSVISAAAAHPNSTPFYSVEDSLETEESYISRLRLLRNIISYGTAHNFLCHADFHTLSKCIFTIFHDFITEVVPRSSPTSPCRTIAVRYLLDSILSLRNHSASIDPATCLVKQDGDKIVASLSLDEASSTPNIVELLICSFLSLPIHIPKFTSTFSGKNDSSDSNNQPSKSGPRQPLLNNDDIMILQDQNEDNHIPLLLVSLLPVHLRKDVSSFINLKLSSYNLSTINNHDLESSLHTIEFPSILQLYPNHTKHSLLSALSQLSLCLHSSSIDNNRLLLSPPKLRSNNNNISSNTNNNNADPKLSQSLGKRKADSNSNHARASTLITSSAATATRTTTNHNNPIQKTTSLSWPFHVMSLLLKVDLATENDLDNISNSFDNIYNNFFEQLNNHPSLDIIRTLGLVACARSGAWSKVKSTSYNAPARFRCKVCDSTMPTKPNSSTSSSSSIIALNRKFRTITLFQPMINQLLNVVNISTISNNNDEQNVHAYLQSFRRIIRHSLIPQDPQNDIIPKNLYTSVGDMLKMKQKSIAVSAGALLAQLTYRIQELDDQVTVSNIKLKHSPIDWIHWSIQQWFNLQRPYANINAILAMSQIARFANDEVLSRTLGLLIRQLGSLKTIIRSITYNELVYLAQHRNTSPYKMFAPFMPDLSVEIISKMLMHPMLINEFTSLTAIRKDVFLQTNYMFALPYLVLENKQDVIKHIAEAVESTSDHLVLAQAGSILCRLFLETDNLRHQGFRCFQNFLTPNFDSFKIEQEVRSTIETCTADLLASLVIELGNRNEDDVKKAKRALERVDNVLNSHSGNQQEPNVPNLLKDHIIGILAKVNESLERSRSAWGKRKILFGLGEMIAIVGSPMISAAPQIMTTLQSTLEVEDLRIASLTSWNKFVRALPIKDIGPYLGQTSAALVRLWLKFCPSKEEKDLAIAMIHYLILDHGQDLSEYMMDVSDLSEIPALSEAHEKVQSFRSRCSISNLLENFALRIESENDAISSQALYETCKLLSSGLPSSFLAGDAFEPMTGRLLKSLLNVIVRAGVFTPDARDMAFTCIGTLGAVDPDRTDFPPEEAPYMCMSNFEDDHDAADFACYLLENVLVGAYRSTNDTVHQAALAYAIQGLVLVCGFDSTLLKAVSGSSRKSYSSKVINRWKNLPKFVIETITPLFGSSFTIKKPSLKSKTKYPIYLENNSYQKWITTWASDLVECAPSNSAKIFHPFCIVMSHGDVRVAQQMLPHLVLNGLLSSEPTKDNILKEIMAVLQDHVEPKTAYSSDGRLLCAQTIFDILDHWGRWLRRKRMEIYKENKKNRRSRASSKNSSSLNSDVYEKSMLSAVPYELMANVAFKCKAYARALLSLERRLIDLGDSIKSDDLQSTYEQMHEIYAALDEPDAMEGISTKIISPSVAHRIREHESTGQWTSAQSCWEVQLQLKPDDISSHIGLLQCLDNLGHYDSMRTHLVGVLMEHPNWQEQLSPFEITVALAMGDWEKADSVINSFPNGTHPSLVFGKVVHALRSGDSKLISNTMTQAREHLGAPIIAAGKESYNRVYDAAIQLHMLHELELISSVTKSSVSSISSSPTSASPSTLEAIRNLHNTLEQRFQATSPAFRYREAILNMRRTGFRLSPFESVKKEIGSLWLSTSKIARKANHVQAAYSAILQAEQLETPFTFLQNAKLLQAEDQAQRAIQELENSLTPLVPLYTPIKSITTQKSANSNGSSGGNSNGNGNGNGSREAKINDPIFASSLSKASLQRARWMQETGRFVMNEVVRIYHESIALKQDWESPYYHIGHYYDEVFQDPPAGKEASYWHYNLFTCKYYAEALQHGTKYIYQAMPRMLTLWLDMADDRELIKACSFSGPEYTPSTPSAKDLAKHFEKINKYINVLVRKLPVYQWLTVFPQVVSRITHRNDAVFLILENIMAKVLLTYPQQGLWGMVSAANSTMQKRSKRCLTCFQKVKRESKRPECPGYHGVDALIDGAQKLVNELLVCCNHPVGNDVHHLVLSKTFPGLAKLAPSKIVIPLQSSLTVTLPPTTADRMTHKPFPANLTTFHDFLDDIEIMPSLQKPRRITVIGSDGNNYGFLCKPKDDLRKDSRLMEFNSMINKLLKKNSESRKRKLYIRTYAVVPLNEECGLIEWVQNTVPFRNILNNLYESRNIPSWTSKIKSIFQSIRDDPRLIGKIFRDEILSQFPAVFHEWFMEQFPEPNAWFKSRLAYGRTAAVMSMVGFVLGLGDRHGENILFDNMTGDAVHVDFNCLFDRARLLDVPEVVPFRLTHNMVDGLGVTGVEGVFRRACEVTMRILRENKDSLTSVLESFVHDPLVEWNEKKSRKKIKNPDNDDDPGTKETARKALEPIGKKLKGIQVCLQTRVERPASVENQVESLIREATSLDKLGSMYVGWCPYY